MSAIKNVIHDCLDIRHGNDSAAWEAENAAICNGDSDVTLEQMQQIIDAARAAKATQLPPDFTREDITKAFHESKDVSAGDMLTAYDPNIWFHY